MTEDQAKATEAIINMLLKLLFGLCALVGWCFFLYGYIKAKEEFDLYKYGGGGTFLTACMGYVFRHYFGAIRKK